MTRVENAMLVGLGAALAFFAVWCLPHALGVLATWQMRP